ncbi:uncharacterized protein LOC132206711 [Stegostoma tigrinum]|uniref:uncharacterized protein LOC132206711 n=1 Tax=Stegostoma tigrinum TaxID=3053191 RepID=UPI00287078ED|nr:uncharacterized protein LOC132206711 [Stegostoma tigrinum]
MSQAAITPRSKTGPIPGRCPETGRDISQEAQRQGVAAGVGEGWKSRHLGATVHLAALQRETPNPSSDPALPFIPENATNPASHMSLKLSVQDVTVQARLKYFKLVFRVVVHTLGNCSAVWVPLCPPRHCQCPSHSLCPCHCLVPTCQRQSRAAPQPVPVPVPLSTRAGASPALSARASARPALPLRPCQRPSRAAPPPVPAPVPRCPSARASARPALPLSTCRRQSRAAPPARAGARPALPPQHVPSPVPLSPPVPVSLPSRAALPCRRPSPSCRRPSRAVPPPRDGARPTLSPPSDSAGPALPPPRVCACPALPPVPEAVAASPCTRLSPALTLHQSASQSPPCQCLSPRASVTPPHQAVLLSV